ncbi:MAG: hypothetical protein ACFHX7_01630 [Pseudomonadota bacterium]
MKQKPIKSTLLGVGLVVLLALAPVSHASSLMRDIWALIIESPSPGTAAEMTTLGGRTQALYLANGLPAAGEPDSWSLAGARIQVWTRFFMGPTALAISDLQLYRLLRLAADPANKTLAYLRGAYGTVLVSNYVAALAASEQMAVQWHEVAEVAFSPSLPDCSDPRILEAAVRREFQRRRNLHETSIVLTGPAAAAWLGTSLEVLTNDPALSLAGLRLSELRFEEQFLHLFLDSGCGPLVISVALLRTPATPVVLVGNGPLSDTMLELNRYILAETDVR